jgi:chromosome segregation ATPase
MPPQEEQQRMMETKISLLQNSIQEKDLALSAQEAQLSKLNDISRERDFQLWMIVELKRKLSERDMSLEVNAKLSTEVSQLREKLLHINMSRNGSEEGLTMAERSIQEKNSVIANLQALLDKAVKSDNRKQQQLEDLQRERATLLFRLQNATLELGSDRPQQKPRQTELVQQLQQANVELEARNRKLQELLEKFHEVYAALRADHERLVRNRPRLVNYRCLVFKRSECSQKKGFPPNASKEAKLVKSAYLRQVVLQFFSQEIESDRSPMVPLILELVGCTQEQVSVVMRHYSRS